MSKITTALVALVIVVGGALAGLGHDLTTFGSFVMLVVGGIAATEATRARKASQEAAHNTNGRMTDLIAANAAHAEENAQLRVQLEALAVPLEESGDVEGDEPRWSPTR